MWLPLRHLKMFALTHNQNLSGSGEEKKQEDNFTVSSSFGNNWLKHSVSSA